MNEIKFPKHIDLFAVPKSTAIEIVKAAAQNFYKDGYVRGYNDGLKSGYKSGYFVGAIATTCGLAGGYFVTKGLLMLLDNKEGKHNGSESVQREFERIETADDGK